MTSPSQTPLLFRAHRIMIGSAAVCGALTLVWGALTGNVDPMRYVVGGLGGVVAVTLAFYLRWFGRKTKDAGHGR